MALTIELHPYTFALRRPLRTARGSIATREGLWVEVRDGDDVGHGDAAPLPGFSSEDLDETRRALGALSTAELPEPGDDLDGLHGQLSELALPPSAHHGLEQALLTLLARRRGISLAALLSDSEAPGAVPLSTLVDGPDAARAAVQRGAGCLKLKVGVEDVTADLRRVAAVRGAVGQSVRLRLDANGAWSREQALAAFDGLVPLAPECVEQPLATDDLEGLAALRRRELVAVGADESLRTLDDAEAILAAGAADVLILKPQLCGGLLLARRIADLAARRGVAVAPSCSLESRLGIAGAAALAAALASRQDVALWPCGLFPALLPDEELPRAMVAGEPGCLSSYDPSMAMEKPFSLPLEQKDQGRS